MKIIDWLLARLKEPSTLRVITVGAGFVGYNIAPEFVEQITAAVISVIGVIEFCRKENPITKTK